MHARVPALMRPQKSYLKAIVAVITKEIVKLYYSNARTTFLLISKNHVRSIRIVISEVMQDQRMVVHRL